MPPRRARAALALVAVVGTAGCAVPGASPAADSTSSTTSGTSNPSSPAAHAASAPVSCPTPVGKATPKAVWKAALSALRASDTSTYRVQSETALPEGHVTLSRSAKVDAAQGLGEFSGSVAIQGGGKSPTKDTVTVVVDGDEVYLQTASWTGDRKGKWMRLPDASSGDAEVPFDVTLDTLPAELVDFVPHGVKEEYGSTLVFGRIPAPAALSGLGLGHLLLKDRGPGRLPERDPRGDRPPRQQRLSGVGRARRTRQPRQGLVHQGAGRRPRGPGPLEQGEDLHLVRRDAPHDRRASGGLPDRSGAASLTPHVLGRNLPFAR